MKCLILKWVRLQKAALPLVENIKLLKPEGCVQTLPILNAEKYRNGFLCKLGFDAEISKQNSHGWSKFSSGRIGG